MRRKSTAIPVFMVLALVLVIASSPAVWSEESEPGPEGFTGDWVTLALKVGVAIPTIHNDMLPHVLTELEVGLLLPFHDRRLSVVIGGSYTPPGNSGEGNDPRIGDDGGPWIFDMNTHEVHLYLGLTYRFIAPGTRIAVPYLGLLGRLTMLHTTVEGTAGGQALGENTEQSTHGGFAILVGGEITAGPGTFLFEAGYGLSKLGHRITGDTNTGALSITIGYRFFF